MAENRAKIGFFADLTGYTLLKSLETAIICFSGQKYVGRDAIYDSSVSSRKSP